jgi:quinol-cytochrome oxidoreductase complex cytochrome b subunit
LGIATFAAFLITLITGVLLMFYYKPSPEAAYQSIKDIHFVVPTGRFIRNIHRWAGNLMVLTIILHMARAFYTAAYRHPRQFNWLMGMALLVVTLGLSFTGYLLPWDQLAYWATTIGANIAASPQEITNALGITRHFDPGGLQRLILLGSDSVGPEALIRFLFVACNDFASRSCLDCGRALLAHSQGWRSCTSCKCKSAPRPGQRYLSDIHGAAQEDLSIGCTGARPNTCCQ